MKSLLHELRDFDILIILDACRYDMFQEVYHEYLPGQVEPRLSPGSCTIEFLKSVFKGYYPDVIVISATPYLNSLGFEFDGYNPLEHFPRSNIYDVWDYGFDQTRGNTPPNQVAKAFARIYPAKRRHRFLIWFTNPHAPYISIPDPVETPRDPADRVGLDIKILNKLSPSEAKYFYRMDLKLTLQEISNILNIIRKYSDNRNIKITSDHGEILEKRLFGGWILHPCGYNHPDLRIVPYLEVDI